MTKFPILAAALTLGFLLPAHAQTYTVIHTFKYADFPNWSQTMSQSPGGYLLFTSYTVPGYAYELGTGGWFHNLYTFSGTDGSSPASGLVLGTDQRFHGTTSYGGKNNHGTVFRLSPDGKLVVEHNFADGKDGASPVSAPIQSVTGDWYGVTVQIATGTAYEGSVYRIAPGGNYTLLHSFTGPDGARPWGPLVEGSNGLLYGTTTGGGTNDAGTIFSISPNGAFKVLHNFDGTHGKFAFGPLMQASDGNLYGMAEQGGTANAGLIYRVTPGGTFTVVHNFDGGEGGVQPIGGLLEATDGSLYGTTCLGGPGGGSGEGILFRFTLAGQFTKLRDFDRTGYCPVGSLHQHTDGKLYGYTFFGGAHQSGVIYKYDLGLSPFVSYLPIYGQAGVKVTILGQNFQNNSIVRFNGTQAQQVEIHPTYIKAVVPDGATTGPITVQTSKNGQTLTLKSNKTFVIH